ncbi:MAG TPA: RNA polymerase sigma factor, partial [Polyangiaceae bacterium]|nr:RNA polymerase sigma factor [Polyangiaceae bacterium]
MAEPLAPRPRPQLRVLTGGASGAETSYTDTELFEGIAAGDERIARALYRRVLPEVETTLLRLLSQRDARHDELVQSSLERLIAAVSERRYAEACNLNTWASAFATQVALGVLRARQRKGGPRIELGSSEGSASGQRQSERQTEWLRGHVARLAPARAEAIVLHDLMGHPLAEIAIMMRLSLSAAQSRLLRARKELVVELLAQPGKLPDLD